MGKSEGAVVLCGMLCVDHVEFVYEERSRCKCLTSWRPPHVTEINNRPDKTFRQGFTGVLLQQEGVKTSNRFSRHSLAVG